MIKIISKANNKNTSIKKGDTTWQIQTTAEATI